MPVPLERQTIFRGDAVVGSFQKYQVLLLLNHRKKQQRKTVTRREQVQRCSRERRDETPVGFCSQLLVKTELMIAAVALGQQKASATRCDAIYGTPVGQEPYRVLVVLVLREAREKTILRVYKDSTVVNHRGCFYFVPCFCRTAELAYMRNTTCNKAVVGKHSLVG